jgi:hypothetical protein
VRNQRVSVLAMCAVFSLVAGAVWAAGPVVKIDIPFAFIVQGNTMPAGKYEFAVQGEHGNAGLTLQGKGTGKMERLTALTRLADLDSKTHVVFDKVGDTYYLSEIHIPGMDGWAFEGAPGEHTHKMVIGTEK